MGNQVDMPNPAAADLLALWRKCPHLGCLVPAPCESVDALPVPLPPQHLQHPGREDDARARRERGMDRFAVLIEDDGMIVIDTAQYTQGPPNRGLTTSPSTRPLHRGMPPAAE